MARSVWLDIFPIGWRNSSASRASRIAKLHNVTWILPIALQQRFEEILFHLLNSLHERVPLDDLAMAGGCALNSVANGKLFERTPFRRTYIQPAAGDEGLAVGAACTRITLC